MGQLTRWKKGEQRRLIFIDPWHARWLEVEGSGLKWHNYPLAHGRHRSTTKILCRRIPSRHRRKEPYHDSRALAGRRRRGLHYSARTAAPVPSGHVARGIFPDDRGGGKPWRGFAARSPHFPAPPPFARRARDLGPAGPAGIAGRHVPETRIEGGSGPRR